MSQMTFQYDPDINDSLGDEYQGISKVDPKLYDDPLLIKNRLDARGFAKPVQDEILALIAGRVSSAPYRQLWSCGHDVALGTPMYVSGSDCVDPANALNATHAKVIGFVRHKPSPNTCYLDHFWIGGSGIDMLGTGSDVTGGTIAITDRGDAGITPGATAYLADDGKISDVPGTLIVPLGTFKSHSVALLFISPVPLPPLGYRSITHAAPSTLSNDTRYGLVYMTAGEYNMPTGFAVGEWVDLIADDVDFSVHLNCASNIFHAPTGIFDFMQNFSRGLTRFIYRGAGEWHLSNGDCWQVS